MPTRRIVDRLAPTGLAVGRSFDRPALLPTPAPEVGEGRQLPKSIMAGAAEALDREVRRARLSGPLSAVDRDSGNADQWRHAESDQGISRMLFANCRVDGTGDRLTPERQDTERDQPRPGSVSQLVAVRTGYNAGSRATTTRG
jgi:hypothetical protein